MRSGGGKSKGASFEREICVKLSQWVSGGKQDDVYWRSAMSGGRSTVAHRKGKRLAAQAGDISCIHPIGQKFINKFFIECKFYGDLNYSGLLTGKGKLIEFWEEAKTQAAKYGKHPLMIAKQNRYPTMACLNWDGCKEMMIPGAWLTLIAPNYHLRMLDIDTFLLNCKPYV